MNGSPLTPKVALGVVAHPDDLEFAFGGTVAQWAAGGTDVYYYIMTNGNKGSNDRGAASKDVQKTRQDEQRAAAELLGVKDVFFGDYDDGNLCCEQEVKHDIARHIRQLKPEVVLTYDPTVVYSVEHRFINHPDHRAAGQAALDAVYPLARDHLSFPDLLTEGLEPHTVETMLLFNLNTQNWIVDITEQYRLKCEALRVHKSQFGDGKAVIAEMTKFAEAAGQEIGVRYGEAFVRLDID